MIGGTTVAESGSEASATHAAASGATATNAGAFDALATNAAASGAAATMTVGMAVTLGAFTMTFAALLLAYAILRVQAPSWPPPGEAPVPSAWPWPIAATLAALAGSIAIHAARRASGRRRKRALAAAAIAGAAFVGVQIAGWMWLIRIGVHPRSGIVASVVYALTLFHALHALAALVALLPLLVQVLRGRALTTSRLAAVSWFWHLVTMVWLVVFCAVFLA